MLLTVRRRITSREILLLMIILVVTSWFRLQDIDRTPYGIEGDEMHWVIASSFHTYGLRGEDKNLWAELDKMADRFPVFSTTISALTLATGGDLIAIRKALVIVSLFALVCFYGLTRVFFAPKTALVLLLLYALSTYKLITSRLIFPYTLSEVFICLVLILVITFPAKPLVKTALWLFLAGIGTALTLGTVNVAYTLPLIAMGLALKRCADLSFSVKKTILCLIVFLLPVWVTAKIWVAGIIGESTKNYALGNTAMSFNPYGFMEINGQKLVYNAQIILRQLFISLESQTSDMLVSYPGSLVGYAIVILATLGGVIAPVKNKRLTIVFSFFFQIVSMQLLLGLILPRMWFFTLLLLTLIAGIGIECMLGYLNFRTRIFTILSCLFIFLITLNTYIELVKYEDFALWNRSFSAWGRELTGMARKYALSSSPRTLFIVPTLATAVNTEATLALYTLLKNPQSASTIKAMSRRELGVLTLQEFNRQAETSVTTARAIVSDNVISSQVQDILHSRRPRDFTLKRTHYFSEFALNPYPNQQLPFTRLSP